MFQTLKSWFLASASSGIEEAFGFHVYIYITDFFPQLVKKVWVIMGPLEHTGLRVLPKGLTVTMWHCWG